jgi:predicted DNA-binding transcriptional regulator YafY
VPVEQKFGGLDAPKIGDAQPDNLHVFPLYRREPLIDGAVVIILGTVTRSMCAKRALRINYLSLSSGPKKREIVPVALADNGLRWHVRSYDRVRKRFSDFVLTRIAKAQDIDGHLERLDIDSGSGTNRASSLSFSNMNALV